MSSRRSSLTSLLQANKANASLHTVLGYFSPSGLHGEVYLDPETEVPAERYRLLATLLHERTHWLQFVGTSSGLFTAYSATGQSALGLSLHDRMPALSATDLPLLDGGRLTKNEKELWLAFELLSCCVLGGDRPYFDALIDHGARTSRRVISERMIALAGEVLAEQGDTFRHAQEVLARNAILNASNPLIASHRGVGFGAFHLMENAARVNELLKLAEHQSEVAFDLGGSFDGVYGVARELIYELSGAQVTLANDVAMCVLIDWALMTLLPPLFPMTGAESHNIATPGLTFAKLARGFDPSVVPAQEAKSPVDWVEACAQAIYADLGSRDVYVSPPALTAFLIELLGPVSKRTESEPDDAFTPSIPQGDSPRLRFLTELMRRALETRKGHPAFFALPAAYYIEDRRLFHRLFDPLQPPL